MTNIIPFPRRPDHRPVPQTRPLPPYEFNGKELAKLGRWYSAMKYAFPQIQGVMTVRQQERVSAIGLFFGGAGTRPSCLISKHEADGRIYLMWATDHDAPRVIQSISEITEAQIVAIAPPKNEASWLDWVGWIEVLARRTTRVDEELTGLSPNPA